MKKTNIKKAPPAKAPVKKKKMSVGGDTMSALQQDGANRSLARREQAAANRTPRIAQLPAPNRTARIARLPAPNRTMVPQVKANLPKVTPSSSENNSYVATGDTASQIEMNMQNVLQAYTAEQNNMQNNMNKNTGAEIMLAKGGAVKKKIAKGGAVKKSTKGKK